jgi:hypothetical protein
MELVKEFESEVRTEVARVRAEDTGDSLGFDRSLCLLHEVRPPPSVLRGPPSCPASMCTEGCRPGITQAGLHGFSFACRYCPHLRAVLR